MHNSERDIHRVDLHVGKRLKAKRLEKRISQDELANSVNLTFQQVQKYEKGINRISSSKLYDFSKFLGVKVGYFFEGLDEYTNNHAYIAEYASDKYDHNFFNENSDIEELIKAFKAIKDESLKQNILKLVKTISSK